MDNSDQKIILLEQVYDEIKFIWTKFQYESGASDMEVNAIKRTCQGLGKRHWWRLWYWFESLNKYFLRC